MQVGMLPSNTLDAGSNQRHTRLVANHVIGTYLSAFTHMASDTGRGASLHTLCAGNTQCYACLVEGVAEEAAARLQSAEATCAAEIRQADDAAVQRRAEEARLQAQIENLQEAVSLQKHQVRGLLSSVEHCIVVYSIV